MERLKEVGEALTRLPDGYNAHKTVARQLQAKKQMIETGEALDWATAEALAFGTLLLEGFPVRLSGQELYPRHLFPTPLRDHRSRNRSSVICL